MNWPAAVVIASGLIAGALVLSRPAVSQAPGTWTGIGMEGDWGWVVNTATGQIKACKKLGSSLSCIVKEGP